MAEVVVGRGGRVHVLCAQSAGRTRLTEVLRGRVRAVATVRSGILKNKIKYQLILNNTIRKNKNKHNVQSLYKNPNIYLKFRYHYQLALMKSLFHIHL